MTGDRILVRLNPGPAPAEPGYVETLGLDDLVALKRDPAALLRRILAGKPVEGVAVDLRAIPKPFLVGAMLRLLSRGPVHLRDQIGATRRLGWLGVLASLRGYLDDWRDFPGLLYETDRDLVALEAHAPMPRDSIRGPILSLKPDLWLGSKVGGAVAHASGIANALHQAGFKPGFVAFERNLAIDETIPQHVLAPPTRFWNISEAPLLAANRQVLDAWPQIRATHAPACLYMRVSAFHYAGALIAAQSGLPLIAEYNGSEPWIARNWGRAFVHEPLALRVENAVLKSAARITVVSEPLREELLTRGIADERIIVQPNAVDWTRFTPALDATALRARLTPGADCVFGFIGSFGRWHGVPVLVEAFLMFCEQAGENAANCRLLVIGDGAGAGEMRDRVRRSRHGDRIIFAGLVAQKEAPAHLAACDVLIAPHVGNADGSAFFGSPTKLFEYMASGRAIIASRLGQMKEILEDGKTALMVPPGDASALASAMDRLAGDAALRHSFAAAARKQAVARHGWDEAVRRIFR